MKNKLHRKTLLYLNFFLFYLINHYYFFLRQQLLLSHEDEYENFFASFAALSAHYIITNSIHSK